MKSTKIFLTLAMIFFLFIATLSPGAIAKASEIVKDSEGNVVSDSELAEIEEQLRYITEEASVYSDSGKFLGFDMEKIKSTFGTDFDIPHLAAPTSETTVLKPNFDLEFKKDGGVIALPSEPGVSIQSEKVDRCIEDKIKKNYGDLIKFQTYQTIITLMYNKAFGAAAKELIKLGVKGNAATIGITLSYYFFSCLPLLPE